MKKRNCSFAFLLSVIFFLGSMPAMAQDADPVILKVAGEEITKSEFLNIYQKNNVEGATYNRQSLDEYIQLYINFRLKVKEAEALGMDTVRSFVEELAGYRTQLAQPYLIDEKMNSTLLQEAYNRQKEDLRASHLLIKLDRDAIPEDTLTAYKSIMSIRKRALKGEDFGLLAMEYSDDLSARDRMIDNQVLKGNRGDLGYFTAFDMVYPFETGAYNTAIGEVSMPVRSDFGYHLIKVTDRKPAMGQVQVAHILMTPKSNATTSDSAALEQQVNEVYQRLVYGEDFAAMAEQFSEDKSTSSKGGILPWFGSSKMIPDFIEQVSNLKNVNDITKPFKSSYGWHIVKLLDRKVMGTFEENIDELKQQLVRSDRAKKSEEALLQRIRNEYDFSENIKSRADFYKVVTDTIFAGAWDISSASALDENLFTIGNKQYTQQDFAQWLDKNQRMGKKENIIDYVDKMYIAFVNKKLLEYEDGQLESKYPEFRSLMKEYRDGILLFGLTEQKIWSRASQDTLGLEAFYSANKNNYLWDQRADATIYTINSMDKKIINKVKSAIKKGVSDDELLARINTDSTAILSIGRNKYLKGDNEKVDGVNWDKGEKLELVEDGKTTIVLVNDVLAPEPKKLDEARGIVTADYQDYLEKQWTNELRAKYPFEINEAVLSSIQ